MHVGEASEAHTVQHLLRRSKRDMGTQYPITMFSPLFFLSLFLPATRQG